MLKKSPLNKGSSSLKAGKGLRKSSLSPEEQREKGVKDLEKTRKMQAFFAEIWNERPHKSEVSGKSLGNTMYTYFFDHLLEKEIYKDLAYEKENIALCTFEEHQDKTNGHPAGQHQELIDKAKIRFEK